MVDLRYHLASLAAVFVALAVGILLSVALSGKVSSTSESAQQARIEELRGELEAERRRTEATGLRSDAAASLVEDAYPALMEDRLAGRDFAVLFVGSVNGELRSDVEQTLRDAGAGSPARTVALELPLDTEVLDETLDASAELATYAGDDDFGDLGTALGREFVAGGETPLWTALSGMLVEEQSGSGELGVEGVVVVRSWAPTPPDDVGEAEAERATQSLIDGLLEGMDSTGFPVVGVERFATPVEESAIELFRRRGISSVDDVDTIYGRIALAVLLGGGDPGHYGLKDSAQAVTPRIEPVVPEAGDDS